ncbi:hypothetical protein G4D42_11005 [Burkholderia pseudomallei]|uniref:hypothetical protein n=1 Tax=Burkholderia pseudomallei TaxID=28450 RepID=UPI001592C15D|nr:hypothetical protein [Burkholderia pseudomallei]NVI23904.1 hypothetical protein [Burkholderia pseudomallei]
MTADFDARFRGRLQRSIAHGSNRVRTRFHSASDGIASLRLAACGLRLAACGLRLAASASASASATNHPSNASDIDEAPRAVTRAAIGRHAAARYIRRRFRRTLRASAAPAVHRGGPCFHGAAPGTTGIVRDAHGPTPVARRAAETGPARAEAGIMRSAAREPEPDEAGRARCADQWR